MLLPRLKLIYIMIPSHRFVRHSNRNQRKRGGTKRQISVQLKVNKMKKNPLTLPTLYILKVRLFQLLGTTSCKYANSSQVPMNTFHKQNFKLLVGPSEQGFLFQTRRERTKESVQQRAYFLKISRTIFQSSSGIFWSIYFRINQS